LVVQELVADLVDLLSDAGVAVALAVRLWHMQQDLLQELR
jgi:hypothetical protein